MSAGLEGINGIGHCCGTGIWFGAFAAHDIGGFIKKYCDVFLKVDVMEHGDVSLGIDLDHDIDVAPVVASRHRAARSEGFKAVHRPRIS